MESSPQSFSNHSAFRIPHSPFRLLSHCPTSESNRRLIFGRDARCHFASRANRGNAECKVQNAESGQASARCGWLRPFILHSLFCILHFPLSPPGLEPGLQASEARVVSVPPRGSFTCGQDQQKSPEAG